METGELPAERPPQPVKPKDCKQLQNLIVPLLDSEPVAVVAPVNGDPEWDEVSSDSELYEIPLHPAVKLDHALC
eukprot:15387139-Heterocapsa_arctica.AAC.1